MEQAIKKLKNSIASLNKQNIEMKESVKTYLDNGETLKAKQVLERIIIVEEFIVSLNDLLKSYENYLVVTNN